MKESRRTDGDDGDREVPVGGELMASTDEFAELVRRLPGVVEFPGGELWVPYASIEDAVEIAERCGRRLLGMEGVIHGEAGTFPAMSRIADCSGATPDAAFEWARELLRGEWSAAPEDVAPDAAGEYMVSLVTDAQ